METGDITTLIVKQFDARVTSGILASHLQRSRQKEGERRTFARLARHFNPAAVRVHDGLADGEAQPGPSVGAGTGAGFFARL